MVRIAQGGTTAHPALCNPNATSLGVRETTYGRHEGSGSGSGSSQAEGAGTGHRAGQVIPGLTISGGTGRSGGRATHDSTQSSYGITVISSGTNGGATRDLGVFDRSETVYTVYIPMADAGGGPDWSMQYAMLGQASSENGMLTPPVAVKKVPAIVTDDEAGNRATRVFLSAVVSDKGELTVRPPHQIDVRTQQALDALRRWQFLPAQLNGCAVGTKLLIGVAIVSH